MSERGSERGGCRIRTSASIEACRRGRAGKGSRVSWEHTSPHTHGRARTRTNNKQNWHTPARAPHTHTHPRARARTHTHTALEVALTSFLQELVSFMSVPPDLSRHLMAGPVAASCEREREEGRERERESQGRGRQALWRESGVEQSRVE